MDIFETLKVTLINAIIILLIVIVVIITVIIILVFIHMLLDYFKKAKHRRKTEKIHKSMGELK